MNKLEIYWIAAGLTHFCWEHWLFNFSKEKDKRAEKLADATWETGLSRDELLKIFYGFTLLFGGITLPYSILSRTIRKIFNIKDD